MRGRASAIAFEAQHAFAIAEVVEAVARLDFEKRGVLMQGAQFDVPGIAFGGDDPFVFLREFQVGFELLECPALGKGRRHNHKTKRRAKCHERNLHRHLKHPYAGLQMSQLHAYHAFQRHFRTAEKLPLR